MATGLLFAVVTVMEKRLVSRNFENLADFMAAFGAIHICRAVVLFGIAFPSGISLDTAGTLWSLAAGVSTGLALKLYFYALSVEDSTRVAPLVATTPAFTVLIAILLFRESISTMQLFGLAVIVLGSIVISLRLVNNRLRFFNKKAMWAAAASSFFASWIMLSIDQATLHNDPLDTEIVRALTTGVFVGLVSWRKEPLRSAWATLAKTETAILFVVCEGVLAAGFMLLLSYSMSVGPVGPVSAIVTATTPVAILIGVTALNTVGWNVLSEPTSKQTLLVKIAGTVLIVSGIFSLRL